MKYCQVLGVMLLIVSLLLMIGGLSTFMWPETVGKVLDNVKIHYTVNQEPTGVPAIKHSRPKNTYVNRVKITYSYVVEGEEYTNDTISIFSKYFLPQENTGEYEKGSSVTVRYLPFFHGCSVIVSGPPVVVVFVIAILGLFLFECEKIVTWALSVLLKLK